MSLPAVERIKHYASVNGHLPEGDWVDSFTGERYRQIAAVLAPTAGRVLDVGCHDGAGGRSLRALRPSLHLTGMDCVEGFLNGPQSRIYDECLLATSTDIPAPDGSFDAVIAAEFIEHLEPADVAGSLREFQRLLKPGGQVILTTPNPSYIKLKLTGKTVIGGSHLSEHPAKQLAQTLRSIGFDGIEVLGCGRVSRLLGQRVPLLSLYGSYLIHGVKR